jgi:hypothetical protein
MIMKNTIGFIGRLSAVLLITIFLEGMCTLGSALDFEHYSAMGVVFQALMFCLAVWVATEWQYGSFKD